MKWTDAFMVLAVIAMLGCAGRKPAPDMGLIYNEAAAHEGIDRNPVIVIPGILGSKLVDEASGLVVWGAFGGDALDPAKPEDARIFALPIAKPGQPLSQARDSVKADGVLEKLKLRMLGIPLQLSAYVQILQTLGAGGYRDQSLGLSGAVDYGDNHFTCFQFDYDWRRDLAETAADLHRFIQEKQAFVRAENLRRFGIDKPVRFDIVAHSMGGLVARYYMRYGAQNLEDLGPQPKPNWQGCENLERVVLVGTPNGGSLDALSNLVDGRKFGPFLPNYRPALLGTFPSAYQLLPRPRHGAVVDTRSKPPRVVDHLDPEFWRAMDWGLANPKEAALLAQLGEPERSAETMAGDADLYLARMLNRARLFFAAMDVAAEPPAHIGLFLVAGDALDTAAVMGVDLDNKSHRVVENAPGDGTVLRTSVLLDERLAANWVPKLTSPIKFRHFLLLNQDHLGMTKDSTFTDNVLFFLLEAPPFPGR